MTIIIELDSSDLSFYAGSGDVDDLAFERVPCPVCAQPDVADDDEDIWRADTSLQWGRGWSEVTVTVHTACRVCDTELQLAYSEEWIDEWALSR